MYTRLSPIGLNIDVDATEVAGTAYQQLTNMVPKPGRMERVRGYAQVWDQSPENNSPYWLLYTPQLGEITWAWGSIATINTTDTTGTHTDRTPAGMSAVSGYNAWSGGNLNGIAIMNAEPNPGYYWYKDLPLSLELPGLRDQTIYRIMRPFKYNLIGMNYTDTTGKYEDGIHWSESADPGQVPQSWLPTPENDAGDNILADEDGAIVDGLALRDSFFIYKADSVYEMQYIGGNEVFRFTKVFGSTGLLAPNCIVRVKGTHVVLGNGDIYQHDGQNISSLVDGKIREEFFGIIDNESFSSSFVVYSEQTEEVWFCIPLTGSFRPNFALVWNTVTNEFGYRDIPPSSFGAPGLVQDASADPDEPWDGDSGAWDTDTTQWSQFTYSLTEDSIVLCQDGEIIPEYQYQGTFYLTNTTTLADGVPYDSKVSVYGMDLGDPRMRKSIRRIWPRMNAAQDMTFTLSLFSQEVPAAEKALVGTWDFNAVNAANGLPANFNTRYMGVEIYTSDSQDWDISGFDVEYEPRSRF